MPTEFPVEYQLIMTGLCNNLASRIPWLPGKPLCPLILVASETDRLDNKCIRNCAPQSILHLPARPEAVFSAISLSMNQFSYEKRLKERIEKLEDNLHLVRQIERAKIILMNKKGYTDAEAYAELRSLAMEKRMTVASVADALLASQSILS